MNTINKRLLPFRSFDENDVVNEYSLDTTGEYGMLVKISRGDLDDVQGELADSFGSDFDRVSSPYWGVKNKITPSTSGDTKYDVLGLTLYSTLSEDENGENLKYNRQKGIELHSVISGKAVPVVGKGRFTLGVDAYTVTGGAPNPTGAAVQGSVGDVVVPSNYEVGKFDIVPASVIEATGTPALPTEYGSNQVLGRVMATGNGLGGMVQVQLDI